MKQFGLISILLGVGIINAYPQDSIVSIPDTAFLYSLIDVGVDINEDSLISYGEAMAITDLMVREIGISDLTGIEAFVNLNYLNCGENELTNLDVTNNTSLIELNCGENMLTSLEVSSNSSLERLLCGGNLLTDLDVSSNTVLKRLYCGLNQLSALDVSNNIELVRLYCDRNLLASIDISKNTALQFLKCRSNQLSSLDVSANTLLSRIDCWENNLTNLDISYNSALITLNCWSNQLTNLDVSYHPSLQVLDCSSNQLYSLNVSNNTLLTELHCSDNQLTSLDLSGIPNLESLWCSFNDLYSLNVSNNEALRYLSANGNPLGSADFSKNKMLQWIECIDCELYEIDLTGNVELLQLYLGNSTYPCRGHRECVCQDTVSSSTNRISSIDLSTCPLLWELDVSGMALTSLNLSQNRNLRSLCLCSMDSLNQICVWEGFDPDSIYFSYTTGVPGVNFTTECTSGIDEEQFGTFSIFPNPASNNLTIEWDMAESRFYQLSIYDNLGRLVYTQAAISNNQVELDVSQYKSGLFFYKLRNEVDRTFTSGSFIIK